MSIPSELRSVRGQATLSDEDDSDLELTYRQRFSAHDVVAKDSVWREIAKFLQRYVPADGSVLDVACDKGSFIRNIAARERWATDLRDMGSAVGPDVRFVQGDGTRMAEVLPSEYFDAVFMSNYLEHLPSAEAVVLQIRQAFAVLKPGGRLIVLQPNIRLTAGKYWDFLDHKTSLTEKSLEEAACLAGFATTELITRFLPYSTKSRLPQAPWMVWAYLRFRPAWWLMGKQTLYVGRKPGIPTATEDFR